MTYLCKGLIVVNKILNLTYNLTNYKDMRKMYLIVLVALILGSCKKEDVPPIIIDTDPIIGFWVQDSLARENYLNSVSLNIRLSKNYTEAYSGTSLEYTFTVDQVTSQAKDYFGTFYPSQGTRNYYLTGSDLTLDKANVLQINQFHYDVIELTVTSMVLRDHYKTSYIIAGTDTTYGREIFYFSK